MKQKEADELIEIQKQYVNPIIKLPLASQCRDLEAKSTDGKHKFYVHLNRKGSIELHRCTYQMSYSSREILLRLDLDLHKTHLNPSHDGLPSKKIQGPHVHIFREGFGDKIAFPLPEVFPGLDPENLEDAFTRFCRHCNFTKYILQGGLNI